MTPLLDYRDPFRWQFFFAFPCKKCVIPTGAYPDFLPRSTGQSRVCAFLFKERRKKFVNATKVHRKSGVAQWRDLLFLFRFSDTL
jgi:hypothetical protein